MNYLLKLNIGLLLCVLASTLGIDSSVRAEINQTMQQNQQYIGQQTKQLKKPSASQELWEKFRQQQDEFRLQQQHRIEQFRIENKPGELRQQQFYQLRIDQLRQQQRQEIDILRLQRKLRNPQSSFY